MDIEHTSSLDEAKLLGYFETIKSVFLLKLILLHSVLKRDDAGKLAIDALGLISVTKEVYLRSSRTKPLERRRRLWGRARIDKLEWTNMLKSFRSLSESYCTAPAACIIKVRMPTSKAI
jgi:hypothetical protein